MKTLRLLTLAIAMPLCFAQTQEVRTRLLECNGKVINTGEELTRDEWIFNIPPGQTEQKVMEFNGWTMSYPDHAEVYFFGPDHNNNGEPVKVVSLWVGRQYTIQNDNGGNGGVDPDDPGYPGGPGNNGSGSTTILCQTNNSGETKEQCRRGPVALTYNEQATPITKLEQIAPPANSPLTQEQYLIQLFNNSDSLQELNTNPYADPIYQNQPLLYQVAHQASAGLFKLYIHVPTNVCQVKIVFTDEDSVHSIFRGDLECPGFDCNLSSFQPQANQCGEVSVPDLTCSEYYQQNITWTTPSGETVSGATVQATETGKYKASINFPGVFGDNGEPLICNAEGEVDVQDFFSFQIQDIEHPLCDQSPNGSIKVQLNSSYSTGVNIDIHKNGTPSSLDILRIIQSGQESITHDGLSSGSYTVTGQISFGSLTCTHEETFSLQNNWITDDQPTIEPVVCHGQNNGSIVPNFTFNGSIDSSTVVYTWNYQDPAGNNITQGPSPMSALSGLYSGVHSLTLFDEMSGCQETRNYFVPQPDQLIAMAASTPATCSDVNGQISLEISGGNYSVEPGTGHFVGYKASTQYGDQFYSNGAQLLADLPIGNYVINVEDAKGCTTQVNSSVLEDIITVRAAFVPVGCSAVANAYIYSEYNTPADEPIHTYQLTNVGISDVGSTQYIEYNGCEFPTTLEKDGDIPQGYLDVYIPNVFSPNGDGKHETFYPYIEQTGLTRKVKSFSIFDRWGNFLYSPGDMDFSDLMSNGWDGTYKGQAMNPGVYVYFFEVENPFDTRCNQIYKGDVTIVK